MRVAGDIAVVFTGALRENAALAGRSLADFGRLAGVLALLPVLLTVPAIGLLSHLRERLMAGVHHRRYGASLMERWPRPVPRPVRLGTAEVA